MRRSSMITIILLVLIIIGLSVALVVTNLPKKEQPVDNPTEDVTPADEKEKPTELPIDGDVAQRAYSILSKSGAFYNLKTGSIDSSKLTQKEMQTIVFLIKYSEYKEPYAGTMIDGRISKANMAKGMKEMFGDVSYTPVTCGPYSNVEYNDADGYYYLHTGFGGGGPFGGRIHGISKVEEYSDRYEITEKYVYVDTEPVTRGSQNRTYGYYYNIYYWHLQLNFLGSYKDNELGNQLDENVYDNQGNITSTFDEALGDVSDYKVYCGVHYNTGDAHEKILTKYFDQATEVKHTFMKAEDGTFYYLKTELIK